MCVTVFGHLLDVFCLEIVGLFWICLETDGKFWEVWGLFWECFGTCLEHVWNMFGNLCVLFVLESVGNIFGTMLGKK